MEIPRHWRLKAQRYRLEGAFCRACGELTFPPRPICPHCAGIPAAINLPLFPVPAQSAPGLGGKLAPIKTQL